MSQNQNTTAVSPDNVISINKGGNASPVEKSCKLWLREAINNKKFDLKVMNGMPIDEIFSLLCVVIQEEILDDGASDVEGVTLDDILGDKVFERSKWLALEILRKRLVAEKAAENARAEEERKQKQQAKQSKADMLAAKALQKAGFDPLSTDADPLKKYVGGNQPVQTKNDTQIESTDSVDVPEEVLRLQKLPVSSKLPDLVFKEGWMAQSMRAHLIQWVKKIQSAKRQLDRVKDKELLELYWAHENKISELIRMCEVIISAWGLHWGHEYKDTEWATDEQNRWMWRQVEDNYPNIHKLFFFPKLESPEEKAAREAAEAKHQKVDAHQRKLFAKLVERLNKANPDGLPEGFAEKRVAKKARQAEYLEQEISDDLVTKIFTDMAINRLYVAENDAEKALQKAKTEVEKAKVESDKADGFKTAMYYARAAGMSEEDLIKGLAEFRQKREQIGVAQSTEVVEKRGPKYGEAKVVAPKPKKDKGDKKKGKNKSDGEVKPAGKGGRQKK